MNRSTHPIEPEEVMAYLDNELAAERAAYVAAHIEACAACAALVADLRGVSARLTTWTVPASPLSLEAAIESELHKQAPPENLPPSRKVHFVWNKSILPRWIWGIAFSAAGIFLIVSLVMPNLLHSPMGVPNRQPEMVDIGPRSQMATQALKESERGGGGSGAQQPFLFSTGDLKNLARVPGKSLPMMIRTASVTLETKQFDATRAAIERIVRAHDGHIGQLQTAAPANQARTLTATLRIPADRLDAALAEVKELGRVVKESQGSDEVTQPYADLVARIANARSTEQRLVEILRTRTGKVTEVLEVEREIAEVREQIERMDAQRKSLENQVSLSTVSLELREEFEKPIGATQPSASTLLWNAMADGLDGAFESALGLALFLLRAGPSLLLWAALLFFPARLAWRRIRTVNAQ